MGIKLTSLSDGTSVVVAGKGKNGKDGVGVPAGGAAGQVLAKKSGEDFDTEWVEPGIDEVDLASDEVVGILPVEKGGTGGVIWPSNESLLINGDFRNPVNRNEKTEYTGNGYTIDNWALIQSKTGTQLTLNDGFISVMFQPNTAFQQIIYDWKLIVNKILTFSFLTADNQLISTTMTFPAVSSSASDYISYKDGSFIVYFQKQEALPYGSVFLYLRNSSVATEIQIVAAKLELGSVQTLAHKEGDTWVLNDPPDYDLEYAKCIQYSPITGEWVGSQHVNSNRFINSLWSKKANIINQLSQNNYTTSDDPSICIDGWIKDGNVVVTLEEGYINVAITANSKRGFYQVSSILDEHVRPNSEVTMSILARAKSGYESVTFNLTNNNKSIKTVTAKSQWTVLSASFTFTGSNNTGIGLSAANDSIDIAGMYLEEGNTQTAFRYTGTGSYDGWEIVAPLPDCSIELAKCQRYMLVLRNVNSYSTIGIANAQTTTSVRAFIPLPTSLRSKPKCTTSGDLSIVSGQSPLNGVIVNAESATDIRVDYVVPNGILCSIIMPSDFFTIGHTYMLMTLKDASLLLDAMD